MVNCYRAWRREARIIFRARSARCRLHREAGTRFQLAFNRHDHQCEVTEVVPGRKLAFTWRYAGFPGDSLVTMELAEEGGGTRLKLTHEGLNHFPHLPRFQRSNFEKDWTGLVGRDLPDYLAGTPS